MNFNKQVRQNLEKLAQECLKQSNKETITENAEIFMNMTKNLNEEEKALFVVIYAGLQWDRGFTQGSEDPEFENCADEE